MSERDNETILNQARETLRIERDAIAGMAQRLGGDFVQASRLLLETTGRVVVCGIG